MAYSINKVTLLGNVGIETESSACMTGVYMRPRDPRFERGRTISSSAPARNQRMSYLVSLVRNVFRFIPSMSAA